MAGNFYRRNDDLFDILGEEYASTMPNMTIRVNRTWYDDSVLEAMLRDNQAKSSVKCLADVENSISELVRSNGAILVKRNFRSLHLHPLHLICTLHSPGQLNVLKLFCSQKPSDVNALDCMSRTPLHHALSPSNMKYHGKNPDGGQTLIDIVTVLIENGADVNAVDREGVSPLHLALDYNQRCQYNGLQKQPVLLRRLINAGADPEFRTRLALTPLHLACSLRGENALKAMKFLISYGSVNAIDNNSRTPLHHALRPPNLEYHGKNPDGGQTLIDIVTVLIENGADVNAVDREGVSPLHLALDFYQSFQDGGLPKQPVLLRKLINAGADPEFRTQLALTPLHLACSLRSDNTLEAMKILISNGNVNATDNNTRTPLHHALCPPNLRYHGNSPDGGQTLIDIVTVLIENGADVNAVDREGLSPLHLTLDHLRSRHDGDLSKQPVLLHILINAGADPEFRTLSALHLACYLRGENALDAMKLLVSNGNVNCTDNHSRTPLHHALSPPNLRYYGKSPDGGQTLIDIVTVLIENGADINAVDCEGLSPLHFALDYFCSCQRGSFPKQLDLLRRLINAGADSELRTRLDLTPLHLACYLRDENALDAMKLLVSDGNVNASDNNSRTPLHHALSPPSQIYHVESPGDGQTLIDIVTVLIENGADVNAVDSKGLSPLHLAIDYFQSCHGDELPTQPLILRMLINAGADPELRTQSALTPLHSACSLRGKNALDAMKLLVSHRNVNAADNHSRTPLHITLEAAEPILSRCKGFFFRDFLNYSAVSECTVEKLGLLLSYGADVNVRDANDLTPLHMALKLYEYSDCLRIVRMLLDHGACSEAKEKYKRTPLHLACLYFDKLLVDLVPWLLGPGDGLNTRDSEFLTPFHCALMGCCVSVDRLQFLIDAGADPTLTTLKGNGSILLACRSSPSNLKAVVSYLMDKGCDINLKNQEGDTPLLCLLRGCYDKKVIHVLIDLGADCNAQNSKSVSPLHLVPHLLDYFEDFEEIIDVLLKGGANVNVVDCEGNTPLHYNVSDEGPQVVRAMRRLLSSGADPNLKNSRGMTPLHTIGSSRWVSADTWVHMAEALLDFGADVNAIDRVSNTPLHRVQRISDENPVPIVRILIDRGANFAAENQNHLTPLALMTNQTYHEMIGHAVLLAEIGRHSFSISELNRIKSQSSYSKRFDDCRSCAGDMKKYLLGNNRVSLMDFLLASYRTAAIFVRNPDILRSLDGLLQHPQFYPYRRDIEDKLDQVKLLNDSFQCGADSLASLVAPVLLPVCVFNKILGYLHVYDMNSLKFAASIKK